MATKKKSNPKIQKLNFPIEILTSKELNDLAKKVGRDLSSFNLIQSFKEVGEVWSSENFDESVLACDPIWFDFLNWALKQKEIFMIGNDFVSASFEEIRQVLLNELEESKERADRMKKFQKK